MAQSMLHFRPVDRKPISSAELRHNRLRLGLSREQLSHQIGVDADTIALWEHGSLEISCPIVLEQVFHRHERTSRYAAHDADTEEAFHALRR